MNISTILDNVVAIEEAVADGETTIATVYKWPPTKLTSGPCVVNFTGNLRESRVNSIRETTFVIRGEIYLPTVLALDVQYAKVWALLMDAMARFDQSLTLGTPGLTHTFSTPAQAVSLVTYGDSQYICGVFELRVTVKEAATFAA